MPEPAQIAQNPQTAPCTTPGEFVNFADSPFQLFQPYPPAGDQPAAIAKLVEGVPSVVRNDERVQAAYLGSTV